MPAQVRAIVWAQWRTLLNFRRGESVAGYVLPLLALLGWYGLWTMLAVFSMLFTANPVNQTVLRVVLPTGLMFVSFYWQMAPLMAASLGASMDLRKLLVYPIPPHSLFGVEVLLRLSTCTEMLLVLGGTAAGLLANPLYERKAAVAALLPFALFNLFLAAGLRNQIERWLARRRVREILVLVMVMLAALPQMLIVTGLPGPARRMLASTPSSIWPWTAAGKLALGEQTVAAWALLLAWVAAAFYFGRWQFGRSLRFDAAAGDSGDRAPERGKRRLDWLFRVPSILLPDPVACIVEKELRSLSRSPRFRLVFLMGFTFGIIVFFPVVLKGRAEGAPAVPSDYLTLVCVYALLLLGDVAFWNVFGFDRAAAQLWFLLPAPVSRVFIAKNLVAMAFVTLEIAAVSIVWFTVRLPLTAGKVLEAFLVTLTLSLYLLAAGNLGSVYYPRAVNPEKSTGSGSAGRTRALLLLVYPIAGIPVLLAYGARYAFNSQAAFYGVLAFAAALGAVLYWVALGSAVAKTAERKDKLLEALTEGEGPLVLT